MKAIANWCFDHRRIVLSSWLLGLVVLGASNGIIGSAFSNDFNLPNTESRTAIDLLKASAPAQAGETDTIVVHANSGTLDDQAARQRVEAMFASVGTNPHVTSVGNFYNSGPNGRVSDDRTIGYVSVQLDQQGNKLPISDIKAMISKAKAAENDTLQVELGGPSVQFASSGGGAGGNITEIGGLIAAALVLFLAFGSIYTMFLPIMCALFALGTGISIIGFLTHAFSIASFGPTLAALIGLGVGIDYALFIVSRHRSNLQQGVDPRESVATALNTSGRAVLFAGITVCIGIMGLMLLGVTFFYGLALSVVIAVLLTVLSAITLLPAMLGFVGMKALSRKQRRLLTNDGPVDDAHDLSVGWSNWARRVQRQKFLLGSVALLVMLALSVPVLSIQLGTTDAGGDPKGSTTREAYDLLAKGFGPGFNGPLQLVAKTNNSPVALDVFRSLTSQIATQPNVASVTPPAELPNTDIAVAQVYPESSPQSQATTKLIDDIRSKVTHPAASNGSVEVHIGGETAIFHDFTNVLSSKLPLFVGVVIGLSFLLLMTVFRSLLIPLVASVMNLLSAAASFGIVVAVFQWGWGASIFGIQQTGPIIAFLPVMAFAILFGLSMDYEVFLVSRMYEEWHRTGSNSEAVALGQAETGRVITAAGTIMVMIFGSFIFGDDATIKLFGVSLASAVLLDALIVRTVLVPAMMNAIGRANWYLPSWLDRVLPKVNVESSESESRT